MNSTLNIAAIASILLVACGGGDAFTSQATTIQDTSSGGSEVVSPDAGTPDVLGAVGGDKGTGGATEHTDGGAGSSGLVGTGGSTGIGGNTVGSGGSTGGTPNTGGTPATGGSTNTGGTTVGTGGTQTGGSTNTGGTTGTGGSNTGGSTGTGGSTDTCGYSACNPYEKCGVAGDQPANPTECGGYCTRIVERDNYCSHTALNITVDKYYYICDYYDPSDTNHTNPLARNWQGVLPQGGIGGAYHLQSSDTNYPRAYCLPQP